MVTLLLLCSLRGHLGHDVIHIVLGAIDWDMYLCIYSNNMSFNAILFSVLQKLNKQFVAT